MRLVSLLFLFALLNGCLGSKTASKPASGDSFAREFKLIDRQEIKDSFSKAGRVKQSNTADAFNKKSATNRSKQASTSDFFSKKGATKQSNTTDAFTKKSIVNFTKKSDTRDSFSKKSKATIYTEVECTNFLHRVSFKGNSEMGDYFSSSFGRKTSGFEKDAFSYKVPRFKGYFDSPDAFSSAPILVRGMGLDADAFTGGGKGRKRKRFIGERGKFSLASLFKSDKNAKKSADQDSFTLSPKEKRKQQERNFRKQGENDLFQRGVLPK